MVWFCKRPELVRLSLVVTLFCCDLPQECRAVLLVSRAGFARQMLPDTPHPSIQVAHCLTFFLRGRLPAGIASVTE